MDFDGNKVGPQIDQQDLNVSFTIRKIEYMLLNILWGKKIISDVAILTFN